MSAVLLDVLGRSRELGFLGPGSLKTQVEHALGFAVAAESRLPAGPPRAVLDLGSGGGLPGLVLGERWPEATLVLLDANERRTAFLEEAVDLLAWCERVSVVRDRAEAAGRFPGLRGRFDLVVARSFGPPAVTAECAAPLLRLGGILVVSEPPEDVEGPVGEERADAAVRAGSHRTRWPASGLALVGMEPLGEYRRRFGYQLIRQEQPCPDRYPRRVGIPTKRPIYRQDPAPGT